MEKEERGGGMYGNVYEGDESYLMMSTSSIVRMTFIWITTS